MAALVLKLLATTPWTNRFPRAGPDRRAAGCRAGAPGKAPASPPAAPRSTSPLSCPRPRRRHAGRSVARRHRDRAARPSRSPFAATPARRRLRAPRRHASTRRVTSTSRCGIARCAQANGDAAAAAAIYVRARAIALRILDRDRRPIDAPARAARPRTTTAPPASPTLWQRYRYAIVAAVAVMSAGGDRRRADGEPRPATRRSRARRLPRPARNRAAAGRGNRTRRRRQATTAPVSRSHEEGAGAARRRQLERDGALRGRVDAQGARERRRRGTQLRDGLPLPSPVRGRAQRREQGRAARARRCAPVAQAGRGRISISTTPKARLPLSSRPSRATAQDVDSLHAIALLERAARPRAGDEGRVRPRRGGEPGRHDHRMPAHGVSRRCPPRATPTRMSRQMRAIDNRCHGPATPVAARRAEPSGTSVTIVQGHVMRNVSCGGRVRCLGRAATRRTSRSRRSARTPASCARATARRSSRIRRALRILYDAGQSVTGGDDPRLGTVHVVLVSHAHGDHIGDMKLKAQDAGTCDNPGARVRGAATRRPARSPPPRTRRS